VITAIATRPLRAWQAALLDAALGLCTRSAEASEPFAWHPEWQKFRLTEGVATVGFLASILAEERYLPGPYTPHWTGGILLDNEVRGLLRGRSDHVQHTASKYADVNVGVLSLFPYFDAAIALGVHRDPEVAAQMFLINAQAQSFTGSVTLFTKWLVGRQRPFARDCGPDGTSGAHTCGSSYDNGSFFSGHTVTAFTGAGLTCVHHEHLPLYGGGAPDTWACVWTLIGAGSSAVLRIVSDDHYASDVVFAAGVGFLSGYVIPSWLHYGFGRTRTPRRAGSVQLVPTLQPVAGGLGIGIAGSM
jgi:membrane-associated phospholipid phosphatase